MKNLTDELLNKLIQLDREVKTRLRLKGLVVPIRHKNGNIKFDAFTVTKDQDGFYSVLDHANEAIVSRINLPHTALLTANNLALGRYKDLDLIDSDKRYGYADFEEQLYKKAISGVGKSLDHFDLSLEKYNTAHLKKKMYRHAVMKSFEKLAKLV
jgi:hypothetical protein